MYANKLATTRRAIENNHTSHSQILEPGDSNFTNPPDPHEPSSPQNFVVEGTHGSSEPMCLLFLN
eukprot:900001-Pelagomonas_calceolata.AAC.1